MTSYSITKENEQLAILQLLMVVNQRLCSLFPLCHCSSVTVQWLLCILGRLSVSIRVFRIGSCLFVQLLSILLSLGG